VPIGPSFRPVVEPESSAVPAMTEPPVLEPPVTETPVTDSLAPDVSRLPRWGRVLPVVFGAATVVLGALGAWAAVQAHDLRASAASANEALVDAGATRAVTRDVTSTVNTIFSYSYADTARTRAAAQRLLTGPAIRQYNQLFALVQQDAPTEKLVVTTRVTNVGVELLTGGRSRLLVFANQQDSRAGTSQTSYGGAMFAVTAVDQGGSWRIESIDTFTGSS
jgi:Mce-associated membrane protein